MVGIANTILATLASGRILCYWKTTFALMHLWTNLIHHLQYWAPVNAMVTTGSAFNPNLTWRKSWPSQGQICKKQLLFLQWSSRHLARMTTTCAPQPCHWAQTCPIWSAQLHNNNKWLSMRQNKAFYFWSRMWSCRRVVQARDKSFEWTPSI